VRPIRSPTCIENLDAHPNQRTRKNRNLAHRREDREIDELRVTAAIPEAIDVLPMNLTAERLRANRIQNSEWIDACADGCARPVQKAQEAAELVLQAGADTVVLGIVGRILARARGVVSIGEGEKTSGNRALVEGAVR